MVYGLSGSLEYGLSGSLEYGLTGRWNNGLNGRLKDNLIRAGGRMGLVGEGRRGMGLVKGRGGRRKGMLV